LGTWFLSILAGHHRYAHITALHCRAAKPEARMDAITSRALLLASVGPATKHAGRTTL
jgi:hypothetical protein